MEIPGGGRMEAVGARTLQDRGDSAFDMGLAKAGHAENVFAPAFRLGREGVDAVITKLCERFVP